MPADTTIAPKVWRGRFYEDLEVGDVFRSRLGRTITETDNIWFTCLTMNTNQIHFNVPYTQGTQFGQPLVNSGFTLALVMGLTVPDTSENAAANLGWGDITLPKPPPPVGAPAPLPPPTKPASYGSAESASSAAHPP